MALRFGHLHFSGLRLLQQKQVVRGLPPIKEPSSTCECFILGKKHRESFPKGVAYRTKQPLVLVHTNLCGPIRTQLIGGSCYFLTFIDDYSINNWVYFLKQKSETFSKFKDFKALAKNQSDRKIKVLKSDHCGEYDSKAFHDYCKQHGTRRNATTRYTLQQNGVAERKNGTIMKMARNILKGRNLSNEYGAEAIACVAYVINRSPTKSVMNKVPEEAWLGMSCSVSHLKVFGCVAYTHVPKELRGKLDDKGEKFIFIGYSEQSKPTNYITLSPRRP